MKGKIQRADPRSGWRHSGCTAPLSLGPSWARQSGGCERTVLSQRPAEALIRGAAPQYTPLVHTLHNTLAILPTIWRLLRLQFQIVSIACVHLISGQTRSRSADSAVMHPLTGYYWEPKTKTNNWDMFLLKSRKAPCCSHLLLPWIKLNIKAFKVRSEISYSAFAYFCWPSITF